MSNNTKNSRNSSDYKEGFVYGIYRREEPPAARAHSARPRRTADWLRGSHNACKRRPA